MTAVVAGRPETDVGKMGQVPRVTWKVNQNRAACNKKVTAEIERMGHALAQRYTKACAKLKPEELVAIAFGNPQAKKNIIDWGEIEAPRRRLIEHREEFPAAVVQQVGVEANPPAEEQVEWENALQAVPAGRRLADLQW